MWDVADNLPASQWDDLVGTLGGYPLQTALWGDAWTGAEGAKDERLLMRRNGRPALLARVEIRRHKLAGKVAWIPQGPLYIEEESAFEASVALKSELIRRGYQICFENYYGVAPPWYREHGIPIGKEAATSIVDLSIGEKALWHELGSSWRNQVRSAERHGVTVREADDGETIARFVTECERHSTTRGFRHRGTGPFIANLLRGSGSASVRAKLYCATSALEFSGGLLVMIVGDTMQLMMSATVRGERSPTRLLQWTTMKAAIDANVARYDLGGVDPVDNPGVAAFKRELGGSEMTIPAIRGFPLSLRGKLALVAGRALRRV